MTKRFQFEWDRENKILLMRYLEKRLTDESLAEVYKALREYAIATEPHAAIMDFTAAIQVDLSTGFIRQLALEEPAVPHAAKRGRVVVFPSDAGFAIARMFQTLGVATRPLLHVVRSFDQALEDFGVDSAQFEPLP